MKEIVTILINNWCQWKMWENGITTIQRWTSTKWNKKEKERKKNKDEAKNAILMITDVNT